MDEKMKVAYIANRSRIAEENQVVDNIMHALEKIGQFHCETLEVSASPEYVKLQGRVASYYQKQVAQAATLPMIGSRQLVNEIEVI